MTLLRDPQKGCPWDREQTLESLKPCVLEEIGQPNPRKKRTAK